MFKRTTFLIGALCLLILANVLMMSYASPVFSARAEGFVSHMAKKTDKKNTAVDKKGVSGFSDYAPAGAKDAYQPMGAFDGVRLETGNASSWRYTKPDEPLNGYFPKFTPGPDNLFMFKDNQCKPECCGASFSCDGGCVCTTQDQKDFLNMRGGNRTAPDAGV